MNSALSKLIVSFRAAKHKQNRRFALAVIFIPNFKEDGTMRRSNGTGAVVKLPGHRRKPYAARITSGKQLQLLEMLLQSVFILDISAPQKKHKNI